MYATYNYTSLIFQTYVQSLLRRDRDLVCSALLDQDGHFYVCGDITMAADVESTLQDMMQEYMSTSQTGAANFIRELRVSRIMEIL